MDYTRQRDFFDPDERQASVTVVGCGGIGSFTALALRKLGVQRLTLVDPDTVEEHNIPNQLFAVEHVGLNKVDATGVLLAEFSGDEDYTLDLIPTRLEDAEDVAPNVFKSDVVVSALDSMEARAALWSKLRLKLRPSLLLDARLAGQLVVLYSVRPSLMSDVDGYEATLHSDDEALEVSCTARSIVDVGFAVASMITRAVRMHLTDEDPVQQVFLNQRTLEVHKGGWS